MWCAIWRPNTGESIKYGEWKDNCKNPRYANFKMACEHNGGEFKLKHGTYPRYNMIGEMNCSCPNGVRQGELYKIGILEDDCLCVSTEFQYQILIFD